MDNITIPNVAVASMIGMAVSLIVSMGLPIALCIIVCKKTRARISSFFIGAATFVLFAMILESLLHQVVLGSTGKAISGNIWLYALYGGLAAGIFEETGRYLAMKLCMKKTLDKPNAILYGVGHGGIEAILLIGLTYVNNLVIAVMINSGQAPMLLAAYGSNDTLYQQAQAQLMAIATAPSWQFYMAGLERVSAIVFHICASYMVYLAVKEKKLPYYLLAILLHFLMDALVVVAANYLPIIYVEIFLLLFSGVFGYIVWRMYHRSSTTVTEAESAREA
ncbi:MAG: YhfC family intramembrane metalloprotease [bacterium]|nr:YhfC family intramembrane metalloprotease [bacterium]